MKNKKLSDDEITARLYLWDEAIAALEVYEPDESGHLYKEQMDQKRFVIAAIDKAADRWLRQFTPARILGLKEKHGHLWKGEKSENAG